MEVKISVSPQSIARLQQRVKDMPKHIQSTLVQIGNEEVINVKHRIRSSKIDPDGRAWQPWRVSTLRQRRRQGNVARGILWRTGRLLDSIVARTSKYKLRISSNIEYSAYLQNGTPNMAQRQFLGWGRERIRQIKLKMKEAIKK